MARSNGSNVQEGPAIKVNRATKVFVDHDGLDTVALRDLTLNVAVGEFVAVVGPSGCGKSTLLRLIAGLDYPSSGTVSMNGQAVGSPRTDIGFIFQTPILLEWRTILGNVLLQAELRGLEVEKYRPRARDLLASVGLGEFLNHRPHQLSGGMKQRASICRALLHDPPTLLLDEPFGALDALTREQMRMDLENLWLATRKSVVLVTHSIDEAVLLADRVVVISPRPGRVEAVIPVRLSRPRGIVARSDQAFVDLVHEITEIFLSKGVLQEAARKPQVSGQEVA